jgi:hypothetical protein
MRLRYIQIDPEIIAELPNWSPTDLERESEETLKELGITRQANESYLLAWVRTMLAENRCDDNCDNRKRLVEAIREDWNAQLFVWALGGDERKAFGVEDSPAFQEHLARFHAARYLAPGAFYDHDDPRYWDYQPQPAQSSVGWQLVRSGQLVKTILGLLVVAAGVWAASGLMDPYGWRLADVPVLLVWIGLLAAGGGLLLGFLIALGGEDSAALQHLALWVAVPAALIGIGLHLDASRKLEAAARSEHRIVAPRVDEKSVEEVGYIQEIKRVDRLWEHTRSIIWFVKIPATNKLYSCSWESGFAGFAKDDAVKLIHKKYDTDKIHYDSFKDVEVARAGTFEVPEPWEQARIQSYLKNYEALDREVFHQPGRKQFREEFDFDIETPDDYSGFIVGLHGDQAGRSAAVWTLDTEELDNWLIGE